MGRVLCGRISPFFTEQWWWEAGESHVDRARWNNWTIFFFFIFKFRCICDSSTCSGFYFFGVGQLFAMWTSDFIFLCFLWWQHSPRWRGCIFCFSHLTKTMVVLLLFLYFFLSNKFVTGGCGNWFFLPARPYVHVFIFFMFFFPSFELLANTWFCVSVCVWNNFFLFLIKWIYMFCIWKLLSWISCVFFLSFWVTLCKWVRGPMFAPSN